MLDANKPLLTPSHVAATASGACAFVTTAAAAQAAQLLLGVHTGTRILGLRLVPSLLGACTVAAASVASVEVAAWAAVAAAAAAAGERVPLKRADGTPSPTSSVLLGGACFTALGGRFWALSPSSLSTLGAYANTAQASLPATLAYASGAERTAIQQFGRRFGCHTCGARPWLLRGRTRLRYHADHMPPLAEVKVMNRQLWRRVLSAPVQQRFYPQCSSCSSKQGRLLAERTALARKLGSPRLTFRGAVSTSAAVFHAPSLRRPPHAVGAVLAVAWLAAPGVFEAADEAARAAVRRVRLGATTLFMLFMQ
jgi:hypothetical protein